MSAPAYLRIVATETCLQRAAKSGHVAEVMPDGLHRAFQSRQRILQRQFGHAVSNREGKR